MRYVRGGFGGLCQRMLLFPVSIAGRLIAALGDS